MSNYFDSSSNNPYSTTSLAPQLQPSNPSKQLPTICTIMFIVSLILCILRVFSTALSLIGTVMIAKMDSPPPGAEVAILEVITGGFIALFGIIGNSLMLAKKPVGFYFGCLTVLSVLGTYLVSAIQLSSVFSQQQMNQAPNAQAMMVGMIVGAVVVILFRLVLLALYVFALNKFRGWSSQQSQTV